jgi:RHS repeat-associated protein
MTGATGSVAATYAYDAYGNVTASTGTVANPLQYAGQYTDSESGLQYCRARYYDPTVGGFLTRDPLSARTRQPYAYAANSPVNGTDPSGLGLLEAGTALLGGAEDLQTSALWALPFFAADWADAQHDNLVSGDPLRVTIGVLSVFGLVFTVGGSLEISAAVELEAPVAEETSALVRWDPEFAARQLLEGTNVTPAGRSITFHAADRIVNGGRGLAPLGRENLGELDRILDTSSELNYDPLRGTIRVGSARGPYVVVDSETGCRIVTYLGTQ